MMNKNNHSISMRQGMRAAFLLAFAFVLTQSDKALAQCSNCPWVTNGNNLNNTNTGNVGIGTTTPASKLEVIGNIALSPGGRITSNYDFGNYIMPYEDIFTGRMVFRTGGIDRVSILYNGNVGIGTTTPTVPLEIHRIADGTILFRLFDGSGNPFTSAPKMVFNAGGTDIANIQASYNNAQYRLDLGATSTARSISILNSGNVGISTTTPGYRLDVQGGQINASGGLCINGDCRTTWPTGGGSQWTTSGSNIFYDSGNVGIGTSVPSSKLHVVGNVTLTGTGNISASGTITAGNIAAKYQDIAEWVLARHTTPAGTVVVLDTEKSNQVVASQRAYDTRVAGVVSDSPGVILGEAGEGKVKVATTGRVRVKVDATRAPIRVGDLLVTSDKEGIAMRSEPLSLGGTPIHRPGTIIGKALEPLDKGTGQILVLLSLQ